MRLLSLYCGCALVLSFAEVSDPSQYFSRFSYLSVLNMIFVVLLVLISFVFVIFFLYSVALIALHRLILEHVSFTLGAKKKILAFAFFHKNLNCAISDRIHNYSKNCKLLYLLYTHTQMTSSTHTQMTDNHAHTMIFYCNLGTMLAPATNPLRGKGLVLCLSRIML